VLHKPALEDDLDELDDFNEGTGSCCQRRSRT